MAEGPVENTFAYVSRDVETLPPYRVLRFDIAR